MTDMEWQNASRTPLEEEQSTGITHVTPIDAGCAVTLCCGKNLLELPLGDRIINGDNIMDANCTACLQGVEQAEYVPTTEEVGQAYVRLAQISEWPLRGAEFKAWLTKIKTQERKTERERIIGLLMANELDRTILMAIVDLIEGEEQ